MTPDLVVAVATVYIALWIAGVALTIFVIVWLARGPLRRHVKWLLGSSVFTTLMIPLIAALPPLGIAIASNENKFVPDSLKVTIRDWLSLHPLITATALVWPLTLIPLTYLGTWLKKSFAQIDDLTTKEYGLVLRAINEASGHRLKRLGKLEDELQRSPEKHAAHDFFAEVVNPEEQIVELLWGVYIVFQLEIDTAYPGERHLLRIALARMRNKRFEDFVSWLPESRRPSSSEEELGRKECALSCAAETKQIVIVSDIAKELRKKHRHRRFTKGSAGSSGEGSIIAYPIIGSRGDVPYVLSIRSDKTKHFKQSMKPRYRILLDPFSIRLAIEHSLTVIREHQEHERHHIL